MKNLWIQLSPEQLDDELAIQEVIKRTMQLASSDKIYWQILKRSLDARHNRILYNVQVQVSLNAKPVPIPLMPFSGQEVLSAKEVHIIGAGPAGLFCALRCIERGLKPVIIERGKDVRERRRDLAQLNKFGILNEESNYCFGEGGAGTYSDGKLYTRSHKRGNLQRVLDWFCYFGADHTIRIDTHPHIGTNKLPAIIQAMRESILDCGGEIHFNTRLTDIHYDSRGVQSITLNHTDTLKVKQVILATGHSADDVYELLYRQGIFLESKPFALGVRIEHPQEIINQMQYRKECNNPFLPPASYSLVEQVRGRGVFSFCMCPGGIIAPASTHQGLLVVNGWSPSKRNNPFANSGLVVNINEQDYPGNDALAGLRFRNAVEKKAFLAGGGNFVAPAQRLLDFMDRKESVNLPACSYGPGIRPSKLNDILPPFVYESMRQGFFQMAQKIKPYFTNEAVLVATESRTSSPVRIPRNKFSLQHPQVAGLYPCAEGAGYAGGIVSAALDGIRIAELLSL